MRLHCAITTLLVVILIGNMATVPAMAGQPPTCRQTPADSAIRLAAQGIAADQAPLEQLVKQRRKFAARLISGVESSNPARRAVSMYLLGVFRISQGAPVLIRKITFRFIPPKTSRSELGSSSFHPAVGSLSRIGMPSVRAILKVLPTEQGALRRKLMVQVLVGVEGRAVTRFRLRRGIARAPNAAAKANLEAALRDVPPPPHHR